MTKEDIDIAATLGIPVVRKLSEAEPQEKEKYTIYQYGKRYPETQERRRGKRAVQFVVLLDSQRKWIDSKPELIDPADPELFAAQKRAYLAGEFQKRTEPEPEKADEKPKRKKEEFKKPTADDVKKYAEQEYLSIDEQAFMDHYDACGWVVGKNKPMKDWKAAVRNWVRRDGEFGGRKEEQEQKPSSFETDAFFEAALAKSYSEV